MISFLFWNIGKNERAFPFISRLALTYSIDVLFLAECPKNLEVLTESLNQLRRGTYRVADRGMTKVRSISRLGVSDFFPHFNNRNGDMAIWNLAAAEPGNVQVQIAVVHLPSKAGGKQRGDQQ